MRSLQYLFLPCLNFRSIYTHFKPMFPKYRTEITYKRNCWRAYEKCRAILQPHKIQWIRLSGSWFHEPAFLLPSAGESLKLGEYLEPRHLSPTLPLKSALPVFKVFHLKPSFLPFCYQQCQSWHLPNASLCYYFHGYDFLTLDYEFLEDKNDIEYFLLSLYGVSATLAWWVNMVLGVLVNYFPNEKIIGISEVYPSIATVDFLQI